MNSPAPAPAPHRDPGDAIVRRLRADLTGAARDASAGHVTTVAVSAARGRWAAAYALQRGDDPDEVIWGHVRVLALPRDVTDDDHTAYARGGLDGARQWLAAVLCDWCDRSATSQLLAHGDTRRPELACPVHTRQWVGDRPIGYPAPRPLPRLEA